MKKSYTKVKNEVMVDSERNHAMQNAAQVTNVPPLPLPQSEEKRLIQAEVNKDLFAAVHKEIKRKDLKIRQVMEWALRAYLLTSNPKEAARLGIQPGDASKAP